MLFAIVLWGNSNPAASSSKHLLSVRTGSKKSRKSGTNLCFETSKGFDRFAVGGLVEISLGVSVERLHSGMFWWKLSRQ
jgi:hypothetical protein